MEDPNNPKRNLRGIYNNKICELTKVNQITKHRKELHHMEIIVFCSGQMFGEERHLIIHKRK